MTAINTGFKSMTLEEDGLWQAAATANHGTLYTITNYSGSGSLFQIGYYNAGGATDGYFEITTDGNALTWDVNSVSAQNAIAFTFNHNGTADYLTYMFNLEFDTSLLVKMANDDGAGQNISGQTLYGKGSKEYKRKIVSAGNKLHKRDEVYTSMDVMEIHFDGPTGKSSKIQFPNYRPIWEKVDTWFDRQGFMHGQLVKGEFETAQVAERYKWIQKKESKLFVVESPIDNEEYELELDSNGAFDGRDWPGLPKKVIKKPTKLIKKM